MQKNFIAGHMKRAAQAWWDEVKLMTKPILNFTRELVDSVKPKMIGHFTQACSYLYKEKTFQHKLLYYFFVSSEKIKLIIIIVGNTIETVFSSQREFTKSPL